MFVVVQLPFADFRSLITGQRGRLSTPNWTSDAPKGFVRGFGKVSPRNSSSLGLLGESRFADMTNAIRFPAPIEYGEDTWPYSLSIVPWFRRLYFDGYVSGRFELGFMIPSDYEDLIFDGREGMAPIRPAFLAQNILSTIVQINSIDSSKQRVPLHRAATALGLSYVAATTSNAGLMSFPVQDTVNSTFFVGDPFLSIRIASGRPVSDERDRRVLTGHDEPAFFITSARGSDNRNNVIVQASEYGTTEETSEERIKRVLFSHLNSLIFSYSTLRDTKSSLVESSDREVLKRSVATMLDRLSKFTKDEHEKEDPMLREGFLTFANAYAGRIEELSRSLEELSKEWNKLTLLERLAEYCRNTHDLIIRTSVEKTIDIGLKGGV